MFRVIFFIDDKKLPNVLRDLASHHAMEVQAVPVANEVQSKKNGKLAAAASDSGLPPMVDTVWAHFRNSETFAPREVSAFMKSKGFSALSSSYVTKALMNAKLVSRHGKSSAAVYKVR